jgi:hypothetical protein
MQTLPDLRKGFHSAYPHVTRISHMSEFDPLPTKHMYVHGFIYLFIYLFIHMVVGIA